MKNKLFIISLLFIDGILEAASVCIKNNTNNIISVEVRAKSSIRPWKHYSINRSIFQHEEECIYSQVPNDEIYSLKAKTITLPRKYYEKNMSLKGLEKKKKFSLSNDGLREEEDNAG